MRRAILAGQLVQNRGLLRAAAQTMRNVQPGTFASVQFLRIIPMLLLIVSGMARMAQAQIEPALPGSVEYSITSSGQSWIETSDPIVTGSYVEDLLTDRDNQPDGRGIIGIVTGTGFDDDYGVDAATVDFGRGYSNGIVFPELTTVDIVPEPSVLILLPGILLGRAVGRRRHR